MAIVNWPRYTTVDPTPGAADWTTIQGALDYAGQNGAGPAINQRWTIEVNNSNVYNENLVFPSTGGIILMGRGGIYNTVVQGTITIYPGCYMKNIRINLAATANPGFGLRMIATINSRDIMIDNCDITIFHDALDIVSAIEVQGGATGGNFFVQNCSMYVANKYTGSDPGQVARVVGVRLKNDFVSFVKVLNTHIKMSNAATGVARPVLTKVEQVGGTNVWGYTEFANCTWEDVHGFNGVASDSLLCESVNTTHWGILADVDYYNPRGKRPGLVTAYNGSTASGLDVGAPLYSQFGQHFRAQDGTAGGFAVVAADGSEVRCC